MQNIYELMHNPINETQKRMLEAIDSDDFKLPESKEEFRRFVISILVAVDHEANEKEFMDKCLSKAVRVYRTLTSADGEAVYISQIKNQMSRTNYFATLERMAKARGTTAIRLVTRKLVSDGHATLEGNHKIIINGSACSLIGGDYE